MVSRLAIGGTLCALLLASEPATSLKSLLKTEHVQEKAQQGFTSPNGNYTIGVSLGAYRWKYRYTVDSKPTNYPSTMNIDQWVSEGALGLGELMIFRMQRLYSSESTSTSVFDDFRETYVELFNTKAFGSDYQDEIQIIVKNDYSMPVDNTLAICAEYLYGISNDDVDIQIRALTASFHKEDKFYCVQMIYPISTIDKKNNQNSEIDNNLKYFDEDSKELFNEILETFRYRDASK